MSFLELLCQLFYALLRGGSLTSAACFHNVLRLAYLILVNTLELVQVLHTHITGGVSIPAVHIYKRPEAVLFAAVEHPVDRTFLIHLDVVFDEIVQEVVPNPLTAGVAPCSECVSYESQVFFKGICAVNRSDEIHKTDYDIVPEIFFIGDWYAVIRVGNKGLVFTAVPLAARIRQPLNVKGIPPEHTADSIAYQRLYITCEVGTAHGNVLVLDFGGQFVL